MNAVKVSMGFLVLGTIFYFIVKAESGLGTQFVSRSVVLSAWAVLGLSVTGGYVYRGSEIPELHGTYFYSDWVSSWTRSFDFVDGAVTAERDWTEELGSDIEGSLGQPNSYGLDGHGEMYLVMHGGQVYKFTAVR